MGKNQLKSLSGGMLNNEISKLILSTSKDVFSKCAPYVISSVSTTNPEESAISSIVTKAAGISSGSTQYNLNGYSVDKPNTGYHPLFFYLYKYRGSVDIDTLELLSQKFSPFSISVREDFSTEGFNCVGMAAYYLNLGADGSWDNAGLAGWIKTQLEKARDSNVSHVDSIFSDAYSVWAVSGNVRDFTNGGSNNAFGAISNILEKINAQHSSWWSSQDEEEINNEEVEVSDFESTYNSIAGAVLPDVISYDFYTIWMVEFGKEIA
jgi:hypothetical protein